MFPEEMIKKLQKAKLCVILSGAGISAESGVPTFRDAQTGLWAKYNPEELATPYAFSRNPKLVWEWYQFRRELVAKVEPNPAHYALVDLEKYYQGKTGETKESEFWLITQNVDGLHRLAGNKNVLELHGNIQRFKCSEENIEIPEEKWDKSTIPPKCPCGAYIRPNIVWFGEGLPEYEISKSYTISTTTKIFFSIGTSGLVQPAASLPFIAKRSGACVIEINKDYTPITQIADYSFQGKAGEILPKLIEAIINQ